MKDPGRDRAVPGIRGSRKAAALPRPHWAAMQLRLAAAAPAARLQVRAESEYRQSGPQPPEPLQVHVPGIVPGIAGNMQVPGIAAFNLKRLGSLRLLVAGGRWHRSHSGWPTRRHWPAGQARGRRRKVTVILATSLPA